jgi:cell division protein ZapA (FtsZ GTPase activity inhibitor)
MQPLTTNLKEFIMGKTEKNPTITVNDKEYEIEGMTDQQKVMINHITDLDRKLSTTQFNLDQLGIGREAFVKMLATSLETPVEEAA